MKCDMVTTYDLNNREEIYIAYKDKVSSYVRSRVVNVHEAEDIVSSVFLKVYQKLDTFDNSQASLSTWIYTITRNTVIDYYKKQSTQNSFCVSFSDVEEISGDTYPDDELLDSLADALEKLSQRERDIIILHYYQGYSLKRISEMMRMSYINAKVTHSKALSLLRDYL